MIETMTSKLDQSQKTITDLMEFKFSLETKVHAKELEKSVIEKELLNTELARKELVDKHEMEMRMLKADNEKQKRFFEKELDATRRELSNLTLEMDGCRAECAQYKITISTQSASQFALESEKNLYKAKWESSEQHCRDRDGEITSLKGIKAKLEMQISDMEIRMHKEEQLRRFMHNEIQVKLFNKELKGNIRVFCRVRPLLDGEINEENSLGTINFPPEKKDTLELYQAIETASGNRQSKSYPFSFDKVFDPSCQQAEVFEEISQLVQSALDGYNICIFAYGQTGSGKTYTMEGPNIVNGPNDAHTGMIPRAVKQIFAASEKLKEKGWRYTMEAQFLEIYNESLRDLLSTELEVKKHEIRHDNQKCRTNVTDCSNVVVESPDQVFLLLERASKNRAVAATNCNERSSRSHSVFTLSLTGTNSITDETCQGVLNLIDLAGSERLSSSGSTGERLKETQAINKSLSSLGDVIYSLANKEAHIPYRNSKVWFYNLVDLSFTAFFGWK
jgi:kinesin family member C1